MEPRLNVCYIMLYRQCDIVLLNASYLLTVTFSTSDIYICIICIEFCTLFLYFINLLFYSVSFISMLHARLMRVIKYILLQ